MEEAKAKATKATETATATETPAKFVNTGKAEQIRRYMDLFMEKHPDMPHVELLATVRKDLRETGLNPITVSRQTQEYLQKKTGLKINKHTALGTTAEKCATCPNFAKMEQSKFCKKFTKVTGLEELAETQGIGICNHSEKSSKVALNAPKSIRDLINFVTVKTPEEAPEGVTVHTITLQNRVILVYKNVKNV